MNSGAQQEKQRTEIVGQLGPSPKDKDLSRIRKVRRIRMGRNSRRNCQRWVSRIICENWWFV